MAKNTTGNLGMLQIPVTSVRSQPLVPGTPEYEAAIARQQEQKALNDARLNSFIEQQQQQPMQQAPTSLGAEVAPNAAGSTAGRNTARSVQLMGGEDDGLFGTGISGGDLLGSAIGAGINYAVGKAGEKDAGDVGKAQGEAYAESYPKIMAAIRDELRPTAAAELAVQQEFAPQQQRLAYEQLVGSEEAKRLPAGYVPGIREYAQLGADVENISRRGAAGTDLDIMRLQGPYMAESTMDQLAITDQPFLQSRDLGRQKIAELLGSINMGGLSGGERAEIERMNARRNMQRGQAGGGGNLTAIENAMQFGSRLDQKRSQLGQALQTATNFMAGSRSGFDPIQATLGRSSGTNQIAGNFQGVQPVQNYMAAGQTAPSNLIQGSLDQDNSFFGRISRGAKTLENFWQGGD